MANVLDQLATFHPLTLSEWQQWLAAHYTNSPGIWLVYYKKASGKPRVSYDDAVEEALCYGWIDGQARRLDDERSMLLFTPRKPRSVWSKPNKERVVKLIEAERMLEAGLLKINIAKQNGSWDALTDSDAQLVPPDLAEALEANQIAQQYFTGFSPSAQKNILAWISSAKRPETRAQRVLATVICAAENKKASPYYK
ncbi:YdeI/OmpD-associated family protein [Hymenobacter volaticus]|uniref:YdeI/OmpD-associated family protein n=1 Tax=Hymenobacter volaticus TaxID=2932254 RepID=A0ABY4G2J5_9BACT|nr:YdeI/OmpD-associated family protein [Hymenobacter volaticus]UOQ65068.1 YdeI/OmpD-associated family protein [Hymenobacter volaticus]